MAFRTLARLQLLSLLLGLSSMDRSGAEAQEFQLLQPRGTVSVSAGETLTLTCSVTGLAPAGPVRWFKDSGSGRRLVYADAGSFPRVTRAVRGSDTDFTIRINDTLPEDAGIYHCVKFKKGLQGPDEEFRSGAGTAVSVGGHTQVSPVAAAAGTVCVLLVILFLVSTYFFVRKKRGEYSGSTSLFHLLQGYLLLLSQLTDPLFLSSAHLGRSPRTARSQIPLPENTRTQSQPTDNKDPDVLYADLQHSAGLQQPKKSAPAEHSEYAAVKVTQAIAR
uniref:Tyrosine-protein phosphatase non-receptor type substrate 1-like n=1 Tax=Gopherus evgoodei TaxID=1825980 RepID=A0A8C4WCK1_9SAUR